MTEQENMMRQIKELEFALVEMNLYLDSHPYCAEALAYFKELTAKHDKLAAQYEESCAPLTARGNTGDRWDWVMTPWPWESCHN